MVMIKRDFVGFCLNMTNPAPMRCTCINARSAQPPQYIRPQRSRISAGIFVPNITKNAACYNLERSHAKKITYICSGHLKQQPMQQYIDDPNKWQRILSDIAKVIERKAANVGQPPHYSPRYAFNIIITPILFFGLILLLYWAFSR